VILLYHFSHIFLFTYICGIGFFTESYVKGCFISVYYLNLLCSFFLYAISLRQLTSLVNIFLSYIVVICNILLHGCRTRVTLKKDGVVLDLVPPPTKVSNLIFGRTWIDSPGEMILTNLTTGDKVVLYFQPCGWFGYDDYFLLPLNLHF